MPDRNRFAAKTHLITTVFLEWLEGLSSVVMIKRLNKTLNIAANRKILRDSQGLIEYKQLEG